jgi:two-component system phosphate regulon response regulator PhoB
MMLDWMLPGMSGIEFCNQLRRSGKYPALPILMLTARGEEADLVRRLATGADDYVVKPFSVPELLARVKALLRRSSPERVSERLVTGDITLDRAARRVLRGSRQVNLGPTEYRLLEVLMESTGRVLTRSQLLDRAWGNTAEIDERTVDVHIGRLRKSLVRGLEADPIRTVRGAGYVLDSGPGKGAPS